MSHRASLATAKGIHLWNCWTVVCMKCMVLYSSGNKITTTTNNLTTKQFYSHVNVITPPDFDFSDVSWCKYLIISMWKLKLLPGSATHNWDLRHYQMYLGLYVIIYSFLLIPWPYQLFMNYSPFDLRICSTNDLNVLGEWEDIVMLMHYKNKHISTSICMLLLARRYVWHDQSYSMNGQM